MKKSIFILVSLLVFCLAATYSVAKTQAAQKPAAHKTFVGTIESVTLADPAKGTKSEIVVVNEVKHKMNFLIKSTTTIYDAQGKATTLDKCKAGDKVTVEYSTTPEGVHEAISVKMMK